MLRQRGRVYTPETSDRIEQRSLVMPLPVLTDEQRKQALEKAAEARRKRAEIKGQLKSGKLTLRDMLSREGDDTVGKMKVSTVSSPSLESMSRRVSFPDLS